jgi:glycosyltransferase involved in cell wall biosynthesis
VIRPAAVHQVIPHFAARDAIGGHTLRLRGVLRDLGYASEIFSPDAHAEVSHEARPMAELGADGLDAWTIYQLSTGHPVAEALMARPEPLVLDYHNITPVEHFAPWEPLVANTLREAREQLARLSPHAVLGLADSAYNAEELRALGCARTAVAPILLDPSDLDVEPDLAVAARLAAAKAHGGRDWLFVGRISPNKCQHRVIQAFAAHRRLHDPAARLHLVGGDSSHRYLTTLQALVSALGLDAAVDLAGSVSPGSLAAHYRAADVFVCLSRHEGFCVPLLEAMHHDVPIVALRSTAVAETLGGAGLVVDDDDPVTVASAVARVLDDPAVAAAAVAAGRVRAADFSPGRTRDAVAAALDALVAGG